MDRLRTDEHRYFSGVRTEIDENGEVRISAPAETHKVVNIAQAEAFKQRIQTTKGGRGFVFTFVNMDRIREVIERVSDSYCGYLLYLQCFIDYDGVIVNTNKSPMTKAQIRKALDVNRNLFGEFMAEMVRDELIYVDNDIYRINPAYHFKGAAENERVIKAFTAKVRELYGEISAKDLGFIYKLLPFIHYETNTVCIDPYETDVAKIQPLNKRQVGEISGMTEKAVYSKIRRLKFGDQYVFAEVKIGNRQFYKLNPFVFYRKPGEPDATLSEIFSIYRSYRNK